MTHHVRGTVEQRFWAKVAKRDGDGCWEWTANRNNRGYGLFAVSRGQTRSAHRVSYEMANGPIPDGLYVCHSCDNPPCVRPSHLWLGTNSQNMLDAVKKGRHAGGFTQDRDAARGASAKGTARLKEMWANGELRGSHGRVFPDTCKNGHDLTLPGATSPRGDTGRRCLECRRLQNRDYHARVRRPQRQIARQQDG